MDTLNPPNVTGMLPLARCNRKRRGVPCRFGARRCVRELRHHRPDKYFCRRFLADHRDGLRARVRQALSRGLARPAIRRERKAFREAICVGNEAALQRVRDKSANGMVTVAAVRALEQIDDEDPRRRSVQESPHVTIRIVNAVPAPAVTTIEHSPLAPEPERPDPYRPRVEYDAQGHRLPVFDPFRGR
jgi:hypothetical protein